MTVLVTDRQGDPIVNVEVRVTGPMERDGKTDGEGNAVFRNMGGGTYRLRFEHPEFITLERDVSMQAGRAAVFNPAGGSGQLAGGAGAAPPRRAQPGAHTAAHARAEGRRAASSSTSRVAAGGVAAAHRRLDP
jgi:hypothetical protein